MTEFWTSAMLMAGALPYTSSIAITPDLFLKSSWGNMSPLGCYEPIEGRRSAVQGKRREKEVGK